jgi:hypothetical protein
MIKRHRKFLYLCRDKRQAFFHCQKSMESQSPNHSIGSKTNFSAAGIQNETWLQQHFFTTGFQLVLQLRFVTLQMIFNAMCGVQFRTLSSTDLQHFSTRLKDNRSWLDRKLHPNLKLNLTRRAMYIYGNTMAPSNLCSLQRLYQRSNFVWAITQRNEGITLKFLPWKSKNDFSLGLLYYVCCYQQCKM